MTRYIAKLVCFGRGGHSIDFGRIDHGSYSSTSRLSGYCSPDNPPVSRDDCEIPDGTPVIDKLPAIETEAGYAWVFKGPMVDVDLVDGDCDECPQPSALFATAVAENAYGGLLAVHAVGRLAGKRGALDSVSLREYIEGWREHGGRIGEYQGGRIIWSA